MKQIIDSHRIPAVPYKRPMTKEGYFKKYEFVYDEYYDCVLCPANQILPMRLTDVPVWLLPAIFAAGAVLGAWGEYTWGPRLIEKYTTEKPMVTEKVITQTETQIAYVPKETVIYREPLTGQEAQKPLDGKMIFNKPEFFFTVNGNPGKFVKTDDERYIFDKNMMQIAQSSTIRLELSPYNCVK